MIFYNGGKEKIYISSADWMVRNLDHRVEAGVLINSQEIKDELKDIFLIQLNDNVKSRVLDNELSNHYATSDWKKKNRSQVEIYNYLLQKANAVTNSENKITDTKKKMPTEVKP
jgi:polyphosphate kinase